jgi:hypothetical protein
LDSLSSARKLVYNVIGHDNKLQGESGKEEGKDEKKKNQKYHGRFFYYFFASADYFTVSVQIVYC